MSDDLCIGFLPQAWNRDRCKRCFRLKDSHGSRKGSTDPPSSTGVKTGSWRDRVYGADKSSSTAAVNNNSYTPSSAKVEERKATSADNVSSKYSSSYTTRASSSTTKTESTANVALNEDPLRRKTKMVILKAEVSVDDEAPEDVSMETTIMADSSPSNSRGPSRRSLSPVNDETGSISFRSAVSGGGDSESNLSKAISTSFESLASTNMDTKSMVTALSGSDEEGGAPDSRASTPTENNSFLRSIKAQLEIMENKCATLEKENANLKTGSTLSLNVSSSGGGKADEEWRRKLKEAQEKLTLAEGMCQDYRDENTVLKCELRELQETAGKTGFRETKKLSEKLKAAETLCEEMMDENETYKKEVADLQHEIEELQDQYREEEIEEFRELQRDLEQTAKNCRVLQFKLRKAERVKDQTEADRQHLEEKLKEVLGSPTGGTLELADSRRLKELESELRIAKEVSVRLHNELEHLEDKRCKMEDENFYLKEKVRELETREKLMEQSRQKYEQRHQAYDHKKPGAKTASNGKTADQTEYNIPQLLRDLQDAVERETDMREQYKFAENDISEARKKINDLETENEGLMQQLAKFTAPGKNRAPMKRSASEGQTQIQLELAEHEASTLKNKMSKLEKENEQMMSRISLLEKEIEKVGGKTEFSDADIRSAVPDTYYKQKIKMLEEELEGMRKQLEMSRNPESDQDFSSISSWSGGGGRRQKLGVRSRSLEESEQPDTTIDLQRKINRLEDEVAVMRKQISDLKMENERLVEENKKRTKPLGSGKSIMASNNISVSSEVRDKMDQMQKDIDRFIGRIAELEKEKEALSNEVERRKKMEIAKEEAEDLGKVAKSFNVRLASPQELREKCGDLIKENTKMSSSLRSEKEKMEELETQLSEYKTIINQSENQKLVGMATKVEVLNKQLREANDRFSAMHRRLVGNTGGQKEKYEDVLKQEIEKLERELAEERSKKSPTIQRKEPTESKSPQLEAVMTKVEAQVNKAFEQIEKLEKTQKAEPSKPSPVMSRYSSAATPISTTTDRAALLKDISKIKAELVSLKETLKSKNIGGLVTNGASQGEVTSTDTKLTEKCSKQEKTIAELREQLELSKHEKDTAQADCSKATERLLQTEDRWNKELEKLKESYENQVKDLKYYLNEAEKAKEEKGSLLTERTSSLTEKTRKLSDAETKITKLESELKTKHKEIQDKLDVERKKAKEFETKYQKLEELYENDRTRLSREREKFKSEMSELKKKHEESATESEKIRVELTKKQGLWEKEKRELESKTTRLEAEIRDAETNVSRKAADMASIETRKLMNDISTLQRKLECDSEDWKRERASLLVQVEQKGKDVEFRLEEQDRMRKEINTLKSRIDEQRSQLEDTRRARDDSREELSRWQQTWARERSELSHKLRQEEKVQQAENQALQLKYENRIKVMEESSRRFQTQLSQTRRERDNLKENLASTEKKLTEMRQSYEAEEKNIQEKLHSAQKQVAELDDTKNELDKATMEVKMLRKNADTDQRLWGIEKDQLLHKIRDLENEAGRSKNFYPGASRTRLAPSPASSSVDISTESREQAEKLKEAMKIAEEIRSQMDEMRKAHEKEQTQLKKQISTARLSHTKERSDLERKIREIQENVKVLEIDRRNMLSTKDDGEQEKMTLQSERDALLQRIHDSEIHQLANKYKLDKVADQLSDLQAKVRYGDATDGEKKESHAIVKKALEQLLSVRDDMAKTRELGRALDTMENADKASLYSWKSGGSGRNSIDTDKESAGERLAPLGSEGDGSPRQVKRSSPRNSKAADNNGWKAVGGGGDSSTWESRVAELHNRLRSPSPAPRKLTNYPEAPPSMVINSGKAVEYSKDGTRYWTPKHLSRSYSLDPKSSFLDARNEKTTAPETDSAQSSTSDLASVQETGGRARTKEKRSIFGLRKSRSVETSGTGLKIGAIGVTVLSPGVQASEIPESLQSSTQELDHKVQKSSSGTRLFDKFRRSSSRQSSLTRQSYSVESDNEDNPEPRKTRPISTKTLSVENIRSKGDTTFTPSLSMQYRDANRYTSAFSRLSNSYSSVRSLTSRYIRTGKY